MEGAILWPLPHSLGAPPGALPRPLSAGRDRSIRSAGEQGTEHWQERDRERSNGRAKGGGREEMFGEKVTIYEKAKGKKSLLRVLAKACEVDHSWIDLLLSGRRGVVGVPAAAVVVRRTVVIGVVVRSILIRVVVRSAGVAFVR